MNYNRQLTIRRQSACVQNILCPTFTVTGNINSITFKREEASTEVYIQTWGLDSEGNAVRGELLGFPIGLYENVARANAPIMYGEILNECNYTVPAIILSGRVDEELRVLRGTNVKVLEKRFKLTFIFSSYSFKIANVTGVKDSSDLADFLRLLNAEKPKGGWKMRLFSPNTSEVFEFSAELREDLRLRYNSDRFVFDFSGFIGAIPKGMYANFELNKIL